MRYLWVLLVVLAFARAEEVEVSADNFKANEIKRYGQFTGHVLVKKGKDTLKADKLIIRFNKKRKPVRYTARGHASIEVFIKNKNYLGKAKELVYIPQTNTYKLQGNAYLEDKSTNKKIYGNNIIVNQNAGKYEVDSKGDEPVKLIFQIDDKKLNNEQDSQSN